MSSDPEALILHCFPKGDWDWRVTVAQAVSRAVRCVRVQRRARADGAPVKRGTTGEPDETLVVLAQRFLRRRYPRAVIHVRDPLATEGDREETWYVYRDGSFRASTVRPAR